MRHAVRLVLFGVFAAVLGLASARAASGAGTTTTSTTTTTTTTATTPSYAPLATSSLPAGCVGAGDAAVVPLSHPPVALGAPASDLGPSGYPDAAASVLAFTSSSVSGSGCSGTKVTLAAVSLLGGAVTAASVEATNGTGTVAGLEIDGTAVSAAAGRTVTVGTWGLLTLDGTVGRIRAPLVLRLLEPRSGLSAGTRIAVAFAATPVAGPAEKHRSSRAAKQGRAKRARTGPKESRRQRAKPAPDLPASAGPMPAPRVLAEAAQDNPVVAIALQYLGVPYEWGGASPKTGFDCSGLVSYVFARLGVALPHYAAAQWYSPDTVWVAPTRLQPGDLVFFTGADGTHKAPGHVGIYVGDGYLIDAPHTGSVVRIDSLDRGWYANQYVGARRIVSKLDVRHLSHATQLGAAAATFHFGFQPPLALAPLGERLGTTAVVRPPSSGYWIRVGGGLGGVLLLLSAGGLFVRRRRSLDEFPQIPDFEEAAAPELRK
jgi:cell wall-associated NlpC family hydrolase